jgi:hypothetical protein
VQGVGVGHQRIGRLPRTKRWRAVVDLLAQSPDTRQFTIATLRAAQERLDRLADEDAVPYCFWILARLAIAARSSDFDEEAARVGVEIRPGESAIGFIARFSQEVADRLRSASGDGAFSELAVESLRSALLHITAADTPTLFGVMTLGIQRAFRAHSTERGFATLARHFFGDFLGRTLRYFLDKELGDHIGPAYGLATVDDAEAFSEALDVHAHETAVLVEQFAGEWYSKRSLALGGADQP